MKTIVKFALSAVLALAVGSTAFADAPANYKPYIDFAQVESDVAPVVKTMYESRELGWSYVGVPFTYFVGGAEDDSPYGFTGENEGILGKCNYTATGLPDGITINTKRGIIYGVPTTVGYFKATITATNSKGSTTFTAAITVKDNPAWYSAHYKTMLITPQQGTELFGNSSDNIYYGDILLTPSYYDSVYAHVPVYVLNGSDYPVGINVLLRYKKDDGAYGGGLRFYVINPEDLEGEWDFNTTDTGDTGTTGVAKSSETPLMAFATTQEVTTDDQEVVADIEVTAPAAAIPSVADVLRGNVTEFDYDLYVMLEIGDGVLFVTDAGDTGELTGETKEFTKRVRSGRHRIFDLKMTPILRLALKGVKVNWYAGCISNDMEVKGQIVTATTEFK